MKNKKGFTLIELLVVVLIIGILTAIAVPQYQVAVAKSRTSKALPILKAIDDAQEAYYLAHGTFTKKIEDLDITLDGTIISPNGVNSLSEQDYKFFCMNQYCTANSDNPNLPGLLFYHSTYYEEHNGANRLCGVEGKNKIARAVCEQIGKLDPIFDEYDWGKNNYYRIN